MEKELGGEGRSPVFAFVDDIAMVVHEAQLEKVLQRCEDFAQVAGLGINHKKYTPFIKSLGAIYSIIVPLGMAIIPIIIYLTK